MRLRRAIRDMAKRVAERCQFTDLPVDLVGFLMEQGARQIPHARASEHGADLGKAETGRFPHRDQFQLQKRLGRKLPAQSMP